MPPYIPPEITDRIISYVELDYHLHPKIYYTMLNCALVSKNWLPASRSRLLQWVDITSTSVYDAFVDNILHAPHMAPWLASVEDVHLWNNNPQDRDGRQKGYTCFIHDFGGHLPNLKFLGIIGADWIARPPHPSFHLAISQFSSLSNLRLDHCQLPSAHMLRRMVHALSTTLKRLWVAEVTWPLARGGILATYTEPFSGPALHHLDVWSGDDCIAAFLGWLSHTPTRCSLRELSFLRHRASEPPNHEVYMAFFKAVAAGLERLSVRYEPLGNFPFQNLRSLRHLELFVYTGHWPNTAALVHALPSETRIRQLKVTQVMKDGQTYSPAVIEQEGLELMEPIFQGDTFTALESVHLEVIGGQMDKSEAATAKAQLLANVQGKLPSVVLRGLITVDVDWWRKDKAHDSPETGA